VDDAAVVSADSGDADDELPLLDELLSLDPQATNPIATAHVSSPSIALLKTPIASLPSSRGT